MFPYSEKKSYKRIHTSIKGEPFYYFFYFTRFKKLIKILLSFSYRRSKIYSYFFKNAFIWEKK